MVTRRWRRRIIRKGGIKINEKEKEEERATAKETDEKEKKEEKVK